MRAIVCAALLGCVAALSGCYSLRGGSVPPHLATVAIPEVGDVSGYGDGAVRQDLTAQLIRRFREDNSLQVVDQAGADCRLEVSIATLRDDIRLGVTGQEYETDRGVIIEARATFTDNVKRRQVYRDRQFVGRSQYSIASGVDGKRIAIRDAITKLTDEILLATVADW